MNTERLEALLWARTDGTIDPQELAELEALLSERPQPQEIERQITVIARGLEELDAAEPPRELRERIDTALAHAAPPTARATLWLKRNTAPSWRARWLPLAACLLIGVAIGYLVHPGTGGSIDRAVVTGAMVTPMENMASPPVEVAFDGGVVVASRSGSDTVVDVTLTRNVELGVTLAGAEGPVGLANLNSTTAAATEVRTETDRVFLRTRGPGTVVLTVSTSTVAEPLRLQVSVNGVVSEDRWIGPVRIEDER